MPSNIPQKKPASGIPKPAGASGTVSHVPTVARSQAGLQSSQQRSTSQSSSPVPNWAELEAKYKADIDALTESAEMATIEKEIAEEKLDSCEKELQELKDKLAEAALQIDMLKSEKQADQSVGAGANESTATVYQLQKVEEQNEKLKQALLKLRDISNNDKKSLEDLQVEYEELQEKALDLELKEQKYLEQIKVYEEQIDVSQNAQEMVEKLSQQKAELEDKLKEMIDEMDCMEKLRDLNEQLLESARINEIDLTTEIDRIQVQYAELNKRKRDMEDYLTDQERTVSKLREENRLLNDQVVLLKNQFKEGESIEQQKHQIENVAYKLNFSETKMAEKEAEISRYKRNLAELEEQMSNLSMITKEQSAQLDELRIKHDAKVSENAELQRALKKKMEEVSELEIRREMAEKKLATIQRDTECQVVNLNRTIETMKGIEVQREEDIKRLMEDNEIIERERRELRDQLNKSNRSLERSLQVGNVSALSMVTAQDASLASLGISFQTSPSNQASPMHNPPQVTAQHNQSLTAQQTSQAGSFSSVTGPTRHISSMSSDTDDSIFLGKVKDLSHAFDQLKRRNYELELKLALNELDGRIPPYTGSSISAYYDLDRAGALQLEVKKLKREIRASIINQQICPKSRQVNTQVRNERFNSSRLALKYQIIENEACSLLSNSNLTRSRTRVPLLQSTPVK